MMKGSVKSVLAAAAVTAAVVVFAPTAHADSRGYMADLQANGVPILGLAGPGRYIQAGYSMCMMLRAGEHPDVVVNSSDFGPIFLWKHQMLGAAQRHLCPDTL